MSTSQDNVILQLYGAGDHEGALRLLMSAHQEKLYAHICRMVGTHSDTDEVLQRTFIKAWKGLEKFRKESQLSTWLFRIASNECLTFLEQRKRKRLTILDEDNAGLSDSPSPSAQEIQDRLGLAMSTLAPKQRAVFVMRYFDALTYKEMADVTGTSIGALKASYHLAVKKIESFLTSD